MKFSTLAFLFSALILHAEINVVVWDEQQPRQKQAYEHFLGNAIASHLETLEGIQVKSVKMDDANKGIGPDILNQCDVLIWWGHVRQGEITPEDCKPIIQRIKEGKMSFIPLHSAHWATPFMEAMNERTRMDAEKKFPRSKQSPNVAFEYIPPAANSLITPAYLALHRRGVATTVRVDLPNCCFPDYRNDGKPSTLETLLPDHPIAKGLPKHWSIASTEMYAEPFHVPEPDQVVFKETFSKGEWFRSGSIWELGKGKVFYFRPGHETFPVYKQKLPLLVIENAVRWLASELPQSNELSSVKNAHNRLQVSISATAPHYHWNGQSISKEELSLRFKQLGTGNSLYELIFESDKDTPLKHVVFAMDAAKGAGLNHIKLSSGSGSNQNERTHP